MPFCLLIWQMSLPCSEACQRVPSLSSESLHTSSSLDLDWEMGANDGERRSNFSCPFSASQGRMAEIQRALLKCPWVTVESTAGKHLPAQTWTCQSVKGRSPTLPSCSSLNCLCFPECPSYKHLSKGIDRGRARNGHYKTRCLKLQSSLTFALFTVSGERYFRKSFGASNSELFSSDGLYGE